MSEVPHGCKSVVVHKRGETLPEMVEALDDKKFLFGVVKTCVNSAGSFSRNHAVFFSYKGHALGQVKTAKIAARTDAVKAFVKEHVLIKTAVTCYDKDSVEADVVSSLREVVVDDSKDIGNLDFGLGDTQATPKAETAACKMFQLNPKAEFGMCTCGYLRADHSEAALAATADVEKPLVAAKGKGKGYSGVQEEIPVVAKAAVRNPLKRFQQSVSYMMVLLRLLKESSSGAAATTEYCKACKKGQSPSAEQVLETVRDDRGTPYNWVLFKPSKDGLEVEDAGGGGIVELSGWLERNGSDKLLYGFVRVAFGTGKLRRAYTFSLQWQGQQCTGVKVVRQKQECKGPMEAKLVPVSFRMNDVTASDEVMPEAVVNKLTATVVVDAPDCDGASSVKDLVDALVDALEEDEEAIQQYHAEENEKAKESLAEEVANARRAVEEAEEERLRRANSADEIRRRAESAEAARIEKVIQEEAMMKMAASSESVAQQIEKIGASEGIGWLLFEIVC